ncbi:MAG: 4Fe-4S dicluster domain-containing protein [Syntrophomonadaceae bacterium]|nr:4Fe-4S dicluster domain-containing protein [Syntrophomonadaceae bacterium]
MEKVLVAPAPTQKDIIRRLEQESGTEVSLCYQCGKCTAGCPAAFAMDYTPRQVIRLLQLEMVDEALKAQSPWICATCETCTTRCPRGVDVASLMDALRREALRMGIVTDHRVATFNQTFLKLVERYGRVHEVGLLMEFNLKTRQLFKDAELGLPMFKRGKVHLLPEVIKDQGHVKQMFARVKQTGGESS